MTYELKLASGKRVTWDGETPEEAARRYVACHPGHVVIAWRKHRRPEVLTIPDVRRITIADGYDR